MTDPNAKIIPMKRLRRGADAARALETADASASETLGQAYIRRHAELVGFMHRRTGDLGAAEELVQELWLCIAEDAERTGMINPDSWLQKIAVNLTLNWLRQHKFRGRLMDILPEDFEEADEAPDPERVALSRQGLEYLKELIEELPPRQRLAFLLFRGEGLSLKETAKRMGIQVVTVQALGGQALRTLRIRLIEAGLWP
jgi:RNA polymerase sigma factor (sigma-70 family)